MFSRCLALLTGVSISLLLAACSGTPVSRGPYSTPVDVVTYNRDARALPFAGRRVSIVPIGDQGASLEFANAADRLAAEIAAVGGQVVERRTGTDLVVTMDADISPPQTLSQSVVRRAPRYADPWYPHLWLGTGYGHRRGFLGYGTGFGSAYRPYYRETLTRTAYPARLRLAVYQAAALGRASPEGRLPDGEVHAMVLRTGPVLADALPALIKGAVQAYPGADGGRRTVDVWPTVSPATVPAAAPATQAGVTLSP